MAETETEQETVKVTEDGTVYVGLKLANPYSARYAAAARALDIRDYAVGETIYLMREYGNALIENGYIQVDPEDKQARREALLLNRKDQPLTIREIAARRTTPEVEQVDGDGQPAEGGEAELSGPAKAEKQQSAADAPSKATPAKK